jgi:uncharacterized protein YdeI (YjbR/CyaY-like superfamily)
VADDCEEGFAHADGAYDHALEAELGYGWIDWLARRIDDDRYMQRFTPLRRRSNWSLRTPRRAEAMIEAETIAPRGLAEVGRTKANGWWDGASGAFLPGVWASLPP